MDNQKKSICEFGKQEMRKQWQILAEWNIRNAHNDSTAVIEQIRRNIDSLSFALSQCPEFSDDV